MPFPLPACDILHSYLTHLSSLLSILHLFIYNSCVCCKIIMTSFFLTCSMFIFHTRKKRLWRNYGYYLVWCIKKAQRWRVTSQFLVFQYVSWRLSWPIFRCLEAVLWTTFFHTGTLSISCNDSFGGMPDPLGMTFDLTSVLFAMLAQLDIRVDREIVLYRWPL